MANSKSYDVRYVIGPTPAEGDLRIYVNSELRKLETALAAITKFVGDADMLLGALEGDFIPTVEGATTPGVCTYNVRNGRYIKIGRLVAFVARADFSGHTGTGPMVIRGLPYAESATIRADITMYTTNAGIPATSVATITPGNNFLEVVAAGHATTVAMVAVAAFILVGFYFTD